jgi:hypothetical protein
MEAKTPRIAAVMALYDLHTTFFPNVIEGISDKDAYNRLDTKANHVAWLAGSLVFQRYELANSLGISGKMEGNDLFTEWKGIQESATYPTLDQYTKDWKKISPLLKDTLLNVTEEKLGEPFDMGGEKMTYFDLVVYTMHREAYFIGQIGLWRRLLGYEAMKYN